MGAMAGQGWPPDHIEPTWRAQATSAAEAAMVSSSFFDLEAAIGPSMVEDAIIDKMVVKGTCRLMMFCQLVINVSPSGTDASKMHAQSFIHTQENDCPIGSLHLSSDVGGYQSAFAHAAAFIPRGQTITRHTILGFFARSSRNPTYRVT